MSKLFRLSEPCEAEIKIQRSRFIAWVHPANDVDTARELIGARSRIYGDATHNCYAYIIGWNQETQYYSDAGEPSGTAGKPMLNGLLSFGLTNAAAVVSRYYGGIKLGVRGLIDAYGQAVTAALNKGVLLSAVPLVRYRIVCDYGIAEVLNRVVKDNEGKLLDSEYAAQVRMLVEIPLDNDVVFRETLDGFVARSGLEYIQKKEL